MPRHRASKNQLDNDRTVGYHSSDKKLIVTVSESMAKRMKKDGWVVHEEETIGFFVIVTLAEGGATDGN